MRLAGGEGAFTGAVLWPLTPVLQVSNFVALWRCLCRRAHAASNYVLLRFGVFGIELFVMEQGKKKNDWREPDDVDA